MAFYESQHTYLKVCLGSLSFYSVCTAVLVMPLHIIHRSSSLYLACLRTSLNCLCFSWALCSANWILPLSKALSCFLPIVLARWDFSFPNDINFFVVAPQLKCKAAQDAAMTIPFLPCNSCLGHLFHANASTNSFAFWVYPGKHMMRSAGSLKRS